MDQGIDVSVGLCMHVALVFGIIVEGFQASSPLRVTVPVIAVRFAYKSYLLGSQAGREIVLPSPTIANEALQITMCENEPRVNIRHLNGKILTDESIFER